MSRTVRGSSCRATFIAVDTAAATELAHPKVCRSAHLDLAAFIMTTQVLALGISNVLADALSMVTSE